MEEGNFGCVWWNSLVCERCDGQCDHFLDCFSDEGAKMTFELQGEFEEACEKVRERYRWE